MEEASPLVDLVHPTGNQFVRHLLAAFLSEHRLGTFHTALGFPEPNWTRVLPGPLRAECERRTYPMSPPQLLARPAREAVRLAAQRFRWPLINRHETGWASVDQVYQDLDRAVARRLEGTKGAGRVRGIYGYEDGCLATFRAAKKRGLKCFYDLPIAYWQTVRALLEEEKLRLPEWEQTLVGTRDSEAKLARKTEELALADVVICPSLFVLESLPTAVREGKTCLVAEFGSPPSLGFLERRPEKGQGRLRLLFAGSMTQRKGLADLFAAMKLLNRHDVELVVMGNPIAPMSFYRRHYADFTHMTSRPHDDVLKLMQTCDVLVLPSIAEGRALVQQEAMANGLPLIVTANAGGEDLVVEGRTGFLVPMRSPEKIAEKIAWFADHRDALPEMRHAAMTKAGEYPWQGYTDRIVSSVNASLTEQQRAAE